MFAKVSTGPTQYTKVVKLNLIAANEQGNPEAIFEFSDKKSAEKFFLDRGDFGTGCDQGGLAASSGNQLFATGHFVLRQDSKNPLKFSLGMMTNKEELSAKDFLRYAHMFSMLYACIAEYRAVAFESFYLAGLNTDKFSDVAKTAYGKDPAVIVLQDLAKMAILKEIVAQDLKFEITIDVHNLDKRSQDYYEKLLALEVEKTRLTKAYEAKEDVVVAEVPSASAEISSAEIVMLRELALEKRLGRGPGSGFK